MIELDYVLDPRFLRALETHDLARATDTDFEFRLFCSDLQFRAGGVSLDARWGWIPILGFATQLLASASAAARGEAPPDVEFTESQDRIRFHLVPDGVRIEATYASASPTVPAAELLSAARAFFEHVTTEISARWPAVAESPAFRQMRTNAAADPGRRPHERE